MGNPKGKPYGETWSNEPKLSCGNDVVPMWIFGFLLISIFLKASAASHAKVGTNSDNKGIALSDMGTGWNWHPQEVI